MALLITGAMGHLGYEIVRQAVAQGVDVVALYRGTFREADAQAIKGLVIWVKADLDDVEAVRALAQSHGVSRCIHCAAVSNEAYARPNPLDAIASNISATANLLEVARLQGWQRFILVSTGSVFRSARIPSRRFRRMPSPSRAISTARQNTVLKC